MASQTRKITLDAAALFFGKVVGLMLGMVRLNYLATYLGVANFGILNFALYFCSLFQVLFDFGISQFLTRDLARDLERSREFVGKAILLKVIIVFAAGLLVGLFGIFSRFDATTNWAILLTTVVFAINGLSMVFLSAFQAHRKMVIVSISNILNDLLLSAFIIIILSQYPFVMTVLLLSIIVALLNLGILFAVYVREIGFPRFQIDMSLWKEFLKESLPIAVSSLGISMYTFIGVTVLKYTRGDIEVGIYSAGYKLISILTLIPITFSQIVYPIFSEFYANAGEKLSKALSDSLRVMLILIIPIALGTVILAPKIFSLLFPPEFLPGVVVLQIIILGNVFGFMDWIIYTFLIAINRQSFSMITSVVVGLSTFLISILVIPSIGYTALPFIQVVVEVSLFIIQCWYLAKIGFRLISIKHFIKPLIASLLMIAVVILMRQFNILLLIIIGILVYSCIMYLIRGFGEQEKEMIRAIFIKIGNTKSTKKYNL